MPARTRASDHRELTRLALHSANPTLALKKFLAARKGAPWYPTLVRFASLALAMRRSLVASTAPKPQKRAATGRQTALA